MKLIVDQKKLNEALTIVNRAISPNNTLQVLNNILIKTKDSRLFFTTTNLEIAIHYSIPAQVEVDGAITIPAKLFTNYVSLLKNNEVSLLLDENSTLVIQSKNEKFKIKGLPVEEFPLIPSIEKNESYSISAKYVRSIADEVCFSASNNIARPVLMGVLFEVKDGVCKAVATDSYRLSEKRIQNESTNLSSIIPSKTLLELSKIISDSDDSVSIHISKNQILFEYKDVTLTSRLIEGNFPDYEKIIPTQNKTTVELNREDFIIAVKKVSLFEQENNTGIRVKIGTGNVIIESMESQFGEGKVELDAKITGEENEISLNSQYLVDILSKLKEELVLFKIDGKLSPVTITQVKDNTLTHIIMPLRA